jgi:hypothetical protein
MSWLITGRQVDAADSDARAYLAAVEAADTQALEPAVRLAVDAFVVGCKADGIWNAIKASCILAGARTLAGALVPLVGTAPTNFNFASGDYNRKTGLVGDGSTKYLDSNRDNNADPQDDNHNAVYLQSAGATGIYIGSTTAGATNAMGFLLSRNRSSSSSSAGGLGAAGFNGVARSNSSGWTVRANSINTGVAIASLPVSASKVLIFARGTAAVPNALTNARLAFYSIGESLDLALLDSRVTTLINAFDAAI